MIAQQETTTMADKESPKAGTEAAKDQRKEIEKDHAIQGRPVSPADDPTDHSVPATQIAAQVDPKGEGGATVNARSMDAVNRADEAAEDRERLEDDKSLAGKIRRSGLFFVRDHSVGREYIGVTPSLDSEASVASQHRSLTEPLSMHPPRTGMQIYPKDGEPFTVADGFGNDTNGGDWARVINPHTEKPLFE
jgi:hypothetical protein